MNQMAERRGATLRMLVPIAYMALIFALSSIPSTSGAGDFGVRRPDTWLSSPIQNSLHIPVYGLLAVLLWWSLIPWARSARLQATTACLVAGAYGVLDELHQMIVPGRSSSITDVLLNFAGVAVGASLFGYVHRKRTAERL